MGIKGLIVWGFADGVKGLLGVSHARKALQWSVFFGAGDGQLFGFGSGGGEQNLSGM